MHDGFEALELGDVDKAKRIGRRLIKNYHSSGFEILALALQDDQEPEEAIEILEEGVSLAPNVWLLWQLLGNYRSEQHKYNEAHEAYKCALQCEQVDADWVNYNIAVALVGEKRFEDAQRALERIDEKSMKPRADALSASILVDQGRKDEAVQLAHSALESMSALLSEMDEDTFDSPASYAPVYALLGQTLRQGGETDVARECVEQGLYLDYMEKSVFSLLRELDNAYSSDAKYFRVLVKGEWPNQANEPDEENLGFVKSFDVVAKSPDDVLDWIKNVEVNAAFDTLRVTEIEELEDRPDDPMGVYRATAYMTFPREQDLVGK